MSLFNPNLGDDKTKAINGISKGELRKPVPPLPPALHLTVDPSRPYCLFFFKNLLTCSDD